MGRSQQPQSHHLTLQWLPGTYAVCRLAADAAVPAWANVDAVQSSGQQRKANGQEPAASPSLHSITRTERELSIIANEAHVDETVKAERGFVAMRVVGTLEFDIVGILATLTEALRKANVPVLAISTYDTDILLVRLADAARAWAALQGVAELDPPEV